MTATESNEVAPLWTPKQAADYLKVEESTVKQWAKLGKIPHRRVGILIRFTKEELDDWTREGGRQAVEAATEKRSA